MACSPLARGAGSNGGPSTNVYIVLCPPNRKGVYVDLGPSVFSFAGAPRKLWLCVLDDYLVLGLTIVRVDVGTFLNRGLFVVALLSGIAIFRGRSRVYVLSNKGSIYSRGTNSTLRRVIRNFLSARFNSNVCEKNYLVRSRSLVVNGGYPNGDRGLFLSLKGVANFFVRGRIVTTQLLRSGIIRVNYLYYYSRLFVYDVRASMASVFRGNS